jgi:hypothetical protein
MAVFLISATKGFPELKSLCDIGCGSILESKNSQIKRLI